MECVSENEEWFVHVFERFKTHWNVAEGPKVCGGVRRRVRVNKWINSLNSRCDMNVFVCDTLRLMDQQWGNRIITVFLFLHPLRNECVHRVQHPLKWTAFRRVVRSLCELRRSSSLYSWLYVESEQRRADDRLLVTQLSTQKERMMKWWTKSSRWSNHSLFGSILK